MIINIFVAVDLVLALFALVIGLYAAYKAYTIEGAEKSAALDRRYELQKRLLPCFYGGVVNFWNKSCGNPSFFHHRHFLNPCRSWSNVRVWVFQAGSPSLWAALSVKLFTLFAFGGWLFFDFNNRRLKNSPLIGSLSRWFVLLIPLLVIDALLDILFFSTLQPLVVPCCMVSYTFNTVLGGCPFCLVTYEMPLLMPVVALFSISLGLICWGFLYNRRIGGVDGIDKEINKNTNRRRMILALVLAIASIIVLIVQGLIGPLGT